MNCPAVSQGLAKSKGRPSIEWEKDGKPQYYCLGLMDLRTEEALDVCRNCPKFVDKAQDDLDEWNKESHP